MCTRYLIALCRLRLRKTFWPWTPWLCMSGNGRDCKCRYRETVPPMTLCGMHAMLHRPVLLAHRPFRRTILEEVTCSLFYGQLLLKSGSFISLCHRAFLKAIFCCSDASWARCFHFRISCFFTLFFFYISIISPFSASSIYCDLCFDDKGRLVCASCLVFFQCCTFFIFQTSLSHAAAIELRCINGKCFLSFFFGIKIFLPKSSRSVRYLDARKLKKGY